MNTKKFFIKVLIALIIISINATFSQESKSKIKSVDAIKPLNAFIKDPTKSKVAAELIPGVEITVDQGPSEEVELICEKIERRIFVTLGGARGFSTDFSKPVLIPQIAQIGLDAICGFLGFCIDGQAFNSSSEFDFNRYLDPIRSVLSVSVQRGNNSNILLGISPYLNFGTEAFKIQPGIGTKYLIQNGASVTAVYEKDPTFQVLKLPEKNARRNLVMLEPNIRIMIGKPENTLQFYIKAAYNIPADDNEYNFTTRDLTGVVRDGRINTDALLKSSQVINKAVAIPKYMTFGLGISVNLTPGKDLIRLSGRPASGLQDKENPQTEKEKETTRSGIEAIIVPNTKVLIELLPGEKGTINTNEEGQFAISFSDIKSIQGEHSSVIKIRFTVMPDNKFKFSSIKNEVEKILSKTDGPFYVFTLMYINDGSQGARGWFDVIQNPLIKQSGQGNQQGGRGAKQGDKPAVKTGDSYQGEVRHF